MGRSAVCYSICKECDVVKFTMGHYTDVVPISEINKDHHMFYAMELAQVYELAWELGAMNRVTKR